MKHRDYHRARLASANLANACRATLCALAVAAAITACADYGPLESGAPSTAVPVSLAKGDKASGGKILFVRAASSPVASIYVMNADGSDTTRLTDGTPDDSPAWSPDFRKIVFTRGTALNPDIVVMTARGRNQQVIGQGYDPVWSPDGKKIAYGAVINGNMDIYVMNADGTGIIQLTTASGVDEGPSWSPDGSRLAFASDRLGGKKEIYVMNADGTQPVKLTSCTGEGANCATPDWSPVAGDDRIAYTIYAPVGRLRTIKADGTGLTTVLNSLASMPSWSGDGTRIAMTMQALGAPGVDIFSVRTDGSDLTRVTLDGGKNANPAWSN